MRRIVSAAVALLVFGTMASSASANTIALGTVNAGTPGSVKFWMGSYHFPSESPFGEGALTIGGTTVPFGNVIGQTAPPDGMVFGDNVFYASGTGPAGQYNSTSNPCCPINAWQTATISGLTAGFHTYTISGMNTVVWSDWNSSTPNWTGTIFIPGSSVGCGDPGQPACPTPEPATMALFGVGAALAGIRRLRRR